MGMCYSKIVRIVLPINQFLLIKTIAQLYQNLITNNERLCLLLILFCCILLEFDELRSTANYMQTTNSRHYSYKLYCLEIHLCYNNYLFIGSMHVCL